MLILDKIKLSSDTALPKFYSPYLLTCLGREPYIFLMTQHGYPSFNTAIVSDVPGIVIGSGVLKDFYIFDNFSKSSCYNLTL